MLGVFVFILLYWFDPAGHEMLDVSYLGAIGFLIYGPVMLIGVSALDLVPKKAAGTSAGFTGLFGYFLGTMGAEAAMGIIVQHTGWNGGFLMLAASSPTLTKTKLPAEGKNRSPRSLNAFVNCVYPA